MVRRANRDNLAYRRIRLEIEGSLKFLPRVGIRFDLGQRFVAHQIPIVIAALHRLHPRNKPAHAVSDQNHLIQRRFFVSWIERFAHRGQIVA